VSGRDDEGSGREPGLLAVVRALADAAEAQARRVEEAEDPDAAAAEHRQADDDLGAALEAVAFDLLEAGAAPTLASLVASERPDLELEAWARAGRQLRVREARRAAVASLGPVGQVLAGADVDDTGEATAQEVSDLVARELARGVAARLAAEHRGRTEARRAQRRRALGAMNRLASGGYVLGSIKEA